MSSTSTTITSPDILSLLQYAVAGKSAAVLKLKESVWAQFDGIFDAIEGNDTTRQMVIDFMTIKKLSKSRLAKLRNFLRQQTGIGKPEDIEALSEQIKITLSEDISFLPKSLEVLVAVVDKFADTFIQMYAYTPDEPTSTAGGVAVKTRRFRRGGEEPEAWEEDEETSDQDKAYVHIIRSLCSHVDSYIRYLDSRGNRAKYGDEHQRKICEEESASGRWNAFRKIALSLKKIRLEARMMQFIEDTHYDTSNDLQGTIESVDAYSILFAAYMPKKDETPKDEK